MVLTQSRQVRLILAACALLVAIAIAYWPGLSGDFIFDDFANLDVIGAFGDAWRWPEFLFYITSGGADPTGRPVALLTFLFDASSWPSDPWPFKRTNLALHLLNTALLAWTIGSLGACLAPGTSSATSRQWVALLAAALWGAHPFLVSTTMYVVQREAMLPMTFMLCAMLAWMRGMRAFAAARHVRGWGWCIFGFGAATLLGGFSKANGFLAPLLVGLVHVYFLRDLAFGSPARRHARVACVLLLGLPTLVIFAYLIQAGISGWGPEPVAGRGWNIQERLMSQPRALWDYIGRFAIPRAGGGGVFVEGFVASRGWSTPLTTLPAALALTLSILLAWGLRRRWPVASFAWMFFVAAHLLESSTVPLELYFEHRNYLPAMFLGWPVATALLAPGPLPRIRTGASAVLVLLLLSLTHQRATVWGSPSLMSALTASHEADSARAQVAAATLELEQGGAAAAVARMRSLVAQHPGSIDVSINAVGIECQATGRLSRDTLASAERALGEAEKWNYGLYLWLRDAAVAPAMVHCEGFGPTGLMNLIAAAERNPHAQIARRKRELHHVRGQVALASGDADQALQQFDRALQLTPDAEYALVQAAALGNAGHPAHALRHLDELNRLETPLEPARVRDMPGLHRWLLEHFDYHGSELTRMRRLLEADVQQRARDAVDQGAHPGA